MKALPVVSVALVLLGGMPAHADTIDCLVSPHRVVDLAFGSAGVVSMVGVDRGDHVRKGQVLASLDTSVEQSNLDIAQAQASATAASEAAQSQLDLADKKLKRNLQLLKQGTLSTGQFEEIQADYNLAKLKVAELEETKRLQALDVTRARAVMAQRVIASPFEAVVVERLVSPGEYVENKPAMTISEIDPLFVDMIAPATAFDSVRLGQPVDISLGHPQGKVVRAAITVVDPFVDASSGTFRIRATLSNPGLAIIPGFRCKADLKP